jgi:serine O-acetyltransferase
MSRRARRGWAATDFAEDMRRWKDRGSRPLGASPSRLHLGAGEVVGLLWRHPALCAQGIYRLARWFHTRRIRVLPSLLERVNLVVFGLEISPSIPIGPGLYLPHPGGTVIMARRIGANASFIHAVTVGMRSEWSFPVLGDGVLVGAGARVLGGIHLGDDCTIGANAVVIDDIPAGATAVGVPARCLPAVQETARRA